MFSESFFSLHNQTSMTRIYYKNLTISMFFFLVLLKKIRICIIFVILLILLKKINIVILQNESARYLLSILIILIKIKIILTKIS